MRVKLLTAVAALVACSGALAELDREYWKNLGTCTGLYRAGDSQNDINGKARVEEKARKERQSLEGDDSYMAGYLFGKMEITWTTFMNNQFEYHPDERSEAFRRYAIEQEDCRSIH